MDPVVILVVAGVLVGILFDHAVMLLHFELLKRSPPARRRALLAEIEAALFPGEA